jgi:hypothetical protein
VSSGQILHPERYLGHGGAMIPNPPRLPEPREFRKLADGTLGELDFRVCSRNTPLRPRARLWRRI